MSFSGIFSIIVAPILLAGGQGYIAKSRHKGEFTAVVIFAVTAFFGCWAMKSLFAYNDSRGMSNSSIIMLIGSLFGIIAFYAAIACVVTLWMAISDTSTDSKKKP